MSAVATINECESLEPSKTKLPESFAAVGNFREAEFMVYDLDLAVLADQLSVFYFGGPILCQRHGVFPN